MSAQGPACQKQGMGIGFPYRGVETYTGDRPEWGMRHRPPHPGEHLRELMRVREMCLVELSFWTRLPYERCRDFWAGTVSLDPLMAARLAHLFSTPIQFWWDMQDAHDAWSINRALNA